MGGIYFRNSCKIKFTFSVNISFRFPLLCLSQIYCIFLSSFIFTLPSSLFLSPFSPPIFMYPTIHHLLFFPYPFSLSPFHRGNGADKSIEVSITLLQFEYPGIEPLPREVTGRSGASMDQNLARVLRKDKEGKGRKGRKIEP